MNDPHPYSGAEESNPSFAPQPPASNLSSKFVITGDPRDDISCNHFVLCPAASAHERRRPQPGDSPSRSADPRADGAPALLSRALRSAVDLHDVSAASVHPFITADLQRHNAGTDTRAELDSFRPAPSCSNSISVLGCSDTRAVLQHP
jgi:hypothetical protein